jgi:hypothetical protein
MSSYIRVGDFVVTQDELEIYAAAQGWTRGVSADQRCQIYQSPEPDDFGRPITLLLPRRGEIHVEEQHLEAAIHLLGRYYELDAIGLAREVFQSRSDIIKNRVANARPDSISVEAASKVLATLFGVGGDSQRIEKAMVLQSKTKLPGFGQMSRLGHTFPGSFGFTVFTPLPGAVQGELGIAIKGGQERPLVPFERRVIERMAREIIAIDAATDADDILPLVGEDLTSDAVSRRMCETMTNLWTKGSNLEVEYNFEWSSRWESSRDIQEKPSPIVLTPKSRKVLEDASKHLKQQERPNQVRQVIRGLVSDLHKIPGEYAKTARDKKKLVTIMWEPIPKQIQRVQVELPPDDYLKAVRAHEEDRSVQIEGCIRRKSPFYELIDPSELTPLKPS